MKFKSKDIIEVAINNILNNEIYEFKLSQKEFKTILKYRELFTNNISNAVLESINNYRKITIKYNNQNIFQIYGNYLLFQEDGILEYYIDNELLVEKFILGKAFKNNYNKLKYLNHLINFRR